MSNFNVIELAPIRRRRTEQKAQNAQVSRLDTWQNRYRDGIDGLVSLRWLRTSSGEIVPFVARSRLYAANGGLA